jgi:cell division septation protein DedD
MHKEISCRFLWYQKIVGILKKLFKGYVIFPILLCISCTSYHVASHEGRTGQSLIDPKESSSSPSLQCKPQSEGLYVVQAGAFTNISNAQALRKNLEDKGYKSYITVSGFNVDKRIFRVLVGKFPDRKQAQSLSEEIKKKENLQVIVALKPPKDKFVVQAGCFPEMTPAKALRKKLADDGYNAYITLSGTGKDKRYNVLLGEFLDRAEAEKLSEEIKKKEDIQVFVNTI